MSSVASVEYRFWFLLLFLYIVIVLVMVMYLLVTILVTDMVTRSADGDCRLEMLCLVLC